MTSPCPPAGGVDRGGDAGCALCWLGAPGGPALAVSTPGGGRARCSRGAL
jgi:hypothetical protein